MSKQVKVKVKNEIFVTSSHYTLKNILSTLVAEINKLMFNMGKLEPGSPKFESMAQSLSYFEYLQNLLTGENEDTCPPEAYAKGVKMVQELHQLGYIDKNKNPVKIITKRESDRQVVKKVSPVEEHIQAHEAEEIVRIANSKIEVNPGEQIKIKKQK